MLAAACQGLTVGIDLVEERDLGLGQPVDAQGGVRALEVVVVRRREERRVVQEGRPEDVVDP